MRSLAYVLTLASLACWNTSPCLAQQPSGPRTLENLLNSDNTQKPAATAQIAGADATDAGPKRPVGTLTRPKDGVKHPDLDKAWADYDAAVSKAAESIKAAINKQFDAATAKGDLDAADKWQTALEKFEKAGEVPTEKEVKAAVGAAVADYKKASEELTKAYETVVKSLTMEKKIADAKAARDEIKAVLAKVHLRSDSPPREEKVAEIKSTQLVGGPGGVGFEDEPPQGAEVAGVVIRRGGLVDAIQVVYRLPNGRLWQGNQHGGNGGEAETFELMPGEKIIGVSGVGRGIVGAIRLHTNKRVSKVYGAGDRPHNIPFEIAIPAGAEFVGFTGRSGSLLDAVGLRYRPRQ